MSKYFIRVTNRQHAVTLIGGIHIVLFNFNLIWCAKKKLTAMICLKFWCFSACILSLIMLLTSYMQGIWISILNGPFYEPPVKTLTELLHRDFTIKLYSSMVLYSMNSDCNHCKDLARKYTPLNAIDLYSAGNQLLEEKNFATVIYEGEWKVSNIFSENIFIWF